MIETDLELSDVLALGLPVVGEEAAGQPHREGGQVGVPADVQQSERVVASVQVAVCSGNHQYNLIIFRQCSAIS